MYFPEDDLAFFKGDTFYEDARGGALVQIVADENETFALSDNACCFGALGIDVWWKLEFLNEVNKLNLPVFFDHQHFSDCGRGLRISTLLALNLD